MQIHVQCREEVDRHLAMVHAAAAKTQVWIAAHSGDPMNLLRSMKFETIGFHPISDHALNVVEQINQTFTYAVALAAVRELLVRHPDAGGFRLAPGAHMSQRLDIMSDVDGLVGAETFAAVTPGNNGKLAGDLRKLAGCTEQYRYVFFASPRFPGTVRLPKFERDGIEVWSVDV
jgi:hypothetical protein